MQKARWHQNIASRQKNRLNEITLLLQEAKRVPKEKRTASQAANLRAELADKAKEALKAAQRAIDKELNTHDIAIAYYQKAYALYRLRDYDAAHTAAVEAGKRDPRNSDVAVLLSFIKDKRKDK